MTFLTRDETQPKRAKELGFAFAKSGSGQLRDGAFSDAAYQSAEDYPVDRV